MEFTQLSLAGGVYADGKSGGGDGDGETSLPVKRKWNTEAHPNTLDLQLQHPLPSDWEQCLDLQSGKMYYVNRKTSRKSWMRPEEQKLDLELNMSTGHNISHKEDYSLSSSSSSMSSNMVALACSNCHLLVILCRSSPSCPNCKYVHSLASSSPKAKSPIGPSNWGL